MTTSMMALTSRDARARVRGGTATTPRGAPRRREGCWCAKSPDLSSSSSSFRRARASTTTRQTTCEASISSRDDDRASVVLIGAGPGGADALTLAAARALAGCDVVMYDDLGGSAEDVLGLTKPGTVRIAVGKRGGDSKSWTQKDVSETLVQEATASPGRVVVRLKGGCPSVFARVSDEIAALRAANVKYKIIPGISSALAAPLSVGIPLTDRELGRHFSVTSAHDPDAIDFGAFSGIDTCVYLMVGKSLPRVVNALVRDAGKDAKTPCAIIRNGMQPDERAWFGSLGDIVRKTSGESLSPCILVVGDVVTLAPQYNSH